MTSRLHATFAGIIGLALCAALGGAYPMIAHADAGCGPAPLMGSTSLIDGGMIRRDNVPHGELAFRNDRADNLVAVLSDSKTMRPFQTIVVGSGTEIQVSAPVGHYGLRIMTGRVWCNLAQGFVGGLNAWLNGGVD